MDNFKFCHTLLLMLIACSPACSQSIQEYFMDFPFKPEWINLDSADAYTEILVDEKNAYLQIVYEDADYDFEYGGEIAFTYFLKSDKTKVFGYTTFFDGPSSAQSSYSFFEYRDDEWIDVTGDVIPEISLANFTSDTELIDSIGIGGYRVKITLPELGTDLRIGILPVGENDSPLSSYETYQTFIQSLPDRWLIWRKEKGLFEFKL